jgi:hypothetical protein
MRFVTLPKVAQPAAPACSDLTRWSARGRRQLDYCAQCHQAEMAGPRWLGAESGMA